jgi:competence protein ComEA
MNRMRTLIAALSLLACTAAVAAGQVNINTADAEALAAAMDGVGVSKAHAIVAYRKANGPFRSVDDLTGVKGVGDKTVERNRDKVTVGNASTK